MDVDSASYIKTRQFLLQSNQLPPANAVRTEDFINYFEYEYAGPVGEDPFAAQIASGACPWQPEHQLVRIGLQATKADIKNRPSANIVFLLDVSGSMNEPNKLPLVKEALRIMVRQLGESDRIAMVVYAGAAGVSSRALEGTSRKQSSAHLIGFKLAGQPTEGRASNWHTISPGIILSPTVSIVSFSVPTVTLTSVSPTPKPWSNWSLGTQRAGSS